MDIGAILNSIAGSPALALLGALVIVSVLIAPLVLRAAGLTGKQIVDLLATTARMFFALITSFREQNKNE